MDERALRRLRKESAKLAREARRVLRVRGGRLPREAVAAVESRIREVERLVPAGDADALGRAGEALRAEVGRHPVLKKTTPLEYIRSLGTAIGVALLIRAFLIEAFKIPTGSMIPTLMVDDHIFVNKFSYGMRIPFTHKRIVDFGTPKRGDIVVFEFPGEGEDKGKDFIKRMVAVAGDRVRLKDNRLYINGEPIPTEVIDADSTCSDATFASCRCVRQRERLGDVEYVTQHLAPPPVNTSAACTANNPDWPSDDPRQMGGRGENPDFPEVIVPEGHVFAMGDNRDNSSDGRYWGFVPIENAKGKALFLWWPPGRWFHGIE